MEYPAEMFEFISKSVYSIRLLPASIIGSCIVFVIIFLQYAIRRHTLSKLLPTKRVGFFNIMGNIEELLSMKKDFPTVYVAAPKYCLDIVQQFKTQPLICYWMSYMPFICVLKAEAVEEIITHKNALKKAWVYNFLHPWLGTGLLTSNGKKWKSRRTLLTPSFHFDILKDFMPVFNVQSQKLVEILQNETSKEYIDIIKPVTLCSLDIICESILGVSIRNQENKESEYVKVVLRVSTRLMARFENVAYWADFIYKLTPVGRQHQKDIKLLHDFTRSIIREKKQKLLNGNLDEFKNKKRKALLDVLLEHHILTKDFTEEDIREEVDTFTFEGHDTTSAALSWAFYLIGLYKDVQCKLHEEMDRIFGDDTDRPVTTDDLKHMTYLECALKETLRLYPSVPSVFREACEDLSVCGYTIPKGTLITIAPFILHRDENVFPDPEKFDPDRFLPENCTDRHPFVYIPFSAGPRNCIGQRFAMMEMKVVIANLLRNFTLESLNSREEQFPVLDVICRSYHPIKIKITSRHPKEDCKNL